MHMANVELTVPEKLKDAPYVSQVLWWTEMEDDAVDLVLNLFSGGNLFEYLKFE